MADSVHPALPHLFEILKIIEGGVNLDRTRVRAFSEQLATKLEAEGDSRTADRLRRVIASARTRDLSPARLSPADRLPVDSESRLALADEAVIAPGEAEVVLGAEPDSIVQEFLRFVQSADKLTRHGVGIAPSMLIYGPPGCGKTELGRFVAQQLGLPLLIGRTDSLISSFLGSTAKNLRALFEHASSRPCVLFLDEFDAVAKVRDDQHEVGELKRVVVSLLQNIDALDNKTILLAATNHEHLLDLAVWRRFAFKVHLERPDASTRARLLSRFLGAFASDELVDAMAQVAEGLTGAEIRQVCEGAKRAAILADSDQVNQGDALRRVLRLRSPSTMDSHKPLSERLKQARALAPDALTYRRLAEAFDVSLGHVSNLLRDGGSH